MAYAATNLACIGNGGAIGSGQGSVARIWHYKTNDTLATVAGSGYFNSATDLLAKGDIIICSGDVDGTPATNVYSINSTTGAATVTTIGLTTATLTYNSRFAINTTVTLTDGDSGHVVAPYAGTISAIYSVLKGGAVTTNDAVCTFKIGSTSITNGALTVTASGSAIGDMDSATPTAARTVAAGDVIKCAVSGTPGGTRTAEVTILIDA